MSLPKKAKINIDTNPPIVGDKYLHYGMDRIEELMRLTDVKTKYLPRTILLENIDQAVFDYVNNDNMRVVIDGEPLKIVYLDNDRFGELQKTWILVDGDKNLKLPYATVRRIDKQAGTRLGTKYRVPQPRLFQYINIPILDEGEVIYLLMKVPEPTNINLTYEVALFTKYRVDVNLYDEQIIKRFASRQEYVFINGSPMPLEFEGFAEANTIENIDGDRFFVAKYALKILAFIQDEKEFEVVKALRKPVLGYVVK
jgi:hypothetical protein